jgi:hypothetical protein
MLAEAPTQPMQGADVNQAKGRKPTFQTANTNTAKYPHDMCNAVPVICDTLSSLLGLPHTAHGISRVRPPPSRLSRPRVAPVNVTAVSSALPFALDRCNGVIPEKERSYCCITVV